MESVDPEDTPEADYGRLLEAAHSSRKFWCARQDSNLPPRLRRPVVCPTELRRRSAPNALGGGDVQSMTGDFV